ncbi:MAG: amidase domain-containing protein [Eubacterium sp.]|nr:amidase domain-containing protein [Eubacterium sp.]
MHFIEYNREKAVAYAKKWVFERNPEYFDFEGLGGDCTNFASQCLYAGCGVMNFQKDFGWYYISLNNRAPAWTSAKYFYRFLIGNSGEGPIASARELHQLKTGDFISLKNESEIYHTLIIVGFENGIPLVAAHSADEYMRPLNAYDFKEAKGIHILGANIF